MPEPRLDSPFQDRPCPFITFYSFKGGVGRSMAVINVAGIVASRGFRVLVIDMDLEAPGISYLANKATEGKDRLQPGFVDFMADAVERGAEADLFLLPAADAVSKYCALYELPEAFRKYPEASLHVMPAGRLDQEYASRLDQLDLPSLYRAGSGLALIKAFKQAVQESKLFDYVFIDSRTGFSDESGICTRDLADYLMIVSGLNKQNVEGTAQFLTAFRAATAGKKEIQVILSPVPNGEDTLVDRREKEARGAYTQAWGKDVYVDLQIPYHPQLALTEEPHIFRRRKGYLFDAYHRIEKRVLRMIGDTAQGFIKSATTALEAKDYPKVLAYLRHAIRLDGGVRSLEGFVITMSEQLPEGDASGLIYDQLANELDGTSVIYRHLAHKLYGARRREAELFFRKAIQASPDDPYLLGSFALVFKNILDLPGEAEKYFLRAIEADPTQMGIIGNFANFLATIRGREDEAELQFRRALKGDPTHAGNLGNFAQFLLAHGRYEEGLQMLSASFANVAAGNTTQAVELHFYAYAHAADKYRKALHALKRLLIGGARSKGWKLELNVKAAVHAGHPEPELLAALARVISEEAEIGTLDAYQAWKEA